MCRVSRLCGPGGVGPRRAGPEVCRMSTASLPLEKLGLAPETTALLRSKSIDSVGKLMLLTDFEAMETLGLSMEAVLDLKGVAGRRLCPSPLTALQLLGRGVASRALPTGLPNLDRALRGGLPAGTVTEVVGPPGMGKTQLCLQVTLLACMPPEKGGMGRKALYLDTERKFSASRFAEIGDRRFPQHYGSGEGRASCLREVGTRVLVDAVAYSADLTRKLRSLTERVIDDGIGLIVVDSIAAHARADFGSRDVAARQAVLAEQAALLKKVAESFSITVLVTNQVTGAFGVAPVAGGPAAAAQAPGGRVVAALGPLWAHAVNTRVAMLGRNQRKWLEVAKSPSCPNVAVPYVVTAAGVQEDPGASPQAVPQGSVLDLPLDDATIAGNLQGSVD